MCACCLIDCNCQPFGVDNGDMTCTDNAGQCNCRMLVTGTKCDRCQDNYYGLLSGTAGSCQRRFTNSLKLHRVLKMLTPVKIYGNEREVFPCGAVKICDKECVKKIRNRWDHGYLRPKGIERVVHGSEMDVIYGLFLISEKNITVILYMQFIFLIEQAPILSTI